MSMSLTLIKYFYFFLSYSLTLHLTSSYLAGRKITVGKNLLFEVRNSKKNQKATVELRQWIQ